MDEFVSFINSISALAEKKNHLLGLMPNRKRVICLVLFSMH